VLDDKEFTIEHKPIAAKKEKIINHIKMDGNTHSESCRRHSYYNGEKDQFESTSTE
jgi:hypothetical protein